MNRKVPDEAHAHIIFLYQEGGTCRSIGLLVGLSPGRVHKILKKNGVVMRPAGIPAARVGTPPGFKRCLKCMETKPTTEFNKGQSDSPDGLFYWCKACRRTYNRDHRIANRERILAQRRGYRKQNPWPYAAAALIKSDVRRGHRVFATPEDRVAEIRRLTEYLAGFQDIKRCGVPGCTSPASEWDEIIYGRGHCPGNVGRLCFRHNRIKRDASVADLEGLLVYMQKLR